MSNSMKNSEYDLEIPQSQTTDKPMANTTVCCSIPQMF